MADTAKGVGYTGDFALLNPPPVLRDEDGQYCCPLPIFDREWADDDTVTTTKRLCGEVLAVEWHIVTIVPDHDGTDAVIEAKDAGGWALWSAWKLACPNGHVLATSADSNGSEDAQPFDARKVWG